MKEINLEPYRLDTGYNYNREVFRKAVKILATGRGDVRSRLRDAWRLSLCSVNHDDLSSTQKDDMNWIIRQLNKFEEDWPGQLKEHQKREASDPTYKYKYSHLYPNPIDATLNRITNKTGEKIANKIYDIYCSLLGQINIIGAG